MILKKPSLAVAGFTSLAFAFNNPAGHYALAEATTRIILADAHGYARQVTGLHNLSFTDFKKDAGFYLMLYYNNDIEKVTAMTDRLDGVANILCIPVEKDPDDGGGDNTIAPCHAVTNRNNKKFKPDKAKVA